MLRKIIFVTKIALLLVSMFVFAFNIKSVKAMETIYIRADGSIDPPTAPIQKDGNLYALIGNIICEPSVTGIEIECSGIILDGMGYLLQGSHGSAGIDMFGISGVTIRNMQIKGFDDGGILIQSCSNVLIEQNTLVGNSAGITLMNSQSITILENSITNSIEAIRLWDSDNNVIRGNIITNSLNHGILLYYSDLNQIEGNDFIKGALFVPESYDNIVVDNFVNYEPIVYLEGVSHYIVEDAGQVILVHCNNITVENLALSYTNCAIQLWGTHNSTIVGNTLTNNRYALFLDASSNNKFYHNIFRDNSVHVSIQSSKPNVWDNGYPSGGNYWSGYTGVDEKRGPNQDFAGSDGICDTPYVINDDNQDRYPWMTLSGPNTSWTDWGHYHNYTEIVDLLLLLNQTYPKLVDVFSIGKSWQNRNIYCIRLTNESNTHPKPKLLFVGYHHARELISAELPLYFAVQAATKFGTNETITHMLNYSEIYIIPALNIDGFEAVSQNEWQRKNTHPYDEDGDSLLDEDPPDDEDGDGYIEDLVFMNSTNYYFIRWEGIDDDGDGLYNEDSIGGVDLNRNYGWNITYAGGSPNSWDETYRGPEPFSEPETRAIRDLALTHSFKYALSFHSGAEYIGSGYSYTNEAHNWTFIEVAENLSAFVGAPWYLTGLGGLPSGTFNDWMYANSSTFAFTCEIYTNETAWQYEPGPEPNTWWEKGVFQYFNPEPNQIETVIQRWLPVFTYMTNRAITEAYNTATINVSPSKTVVGQGYTVNINVTVTNKGEFTETFNVTLYANTTTIETRQITLTSLNSTTITYTWNTTDFAKGNYTLWAYAEPVQGETDTADNTLFDGSVFMSLAGDVTGGSSNPWDFIPDRIVDGKDISILSRCFGLTPDKPNWNPNADINGDLCVDGKDISIASRNFGKSW